MDRRGRAGAAGICSIICQLTKAAASDRLKAIAEILHKSLRDGHFFALKAGRGDDSPRLMTLPLSAYDISVGTDREISNFLQGGLFRGVRKTTCVVFDLGHKNQEAKTFEEISWTVYDFLTKTRGPISTAQRLGDYWLDPESMSERGLPSISGLALYKGPSDGEYRIRGCSLDKILGYIGKAIYAEVLPAFPPCRTHRIEVPSARHFRSEIPGFCGCDCAKRNIGAKIDTLQVLCDDVFFNATEDPEEAYHLFCDVCVWLFSENTQTLKYNERLAASSIGCGKCDGIHAPPSYGTCTPRVSFEDVLRLSIRGRF